MSTQSDDIAAIKHLINHVSEMSQQPTDGKWLEEDTLEASALVRDWDLVACETWQDSSIPEDLFAVKSNIDVGVDLIGHRADGGIIGIQCKSRMRDKEGNAPAKVTKEEMNSFASTTSSEHWAERWVVTNRDLEEGTNARTLSLMSDKPIKHVNIAYALDLELQSRLGQLDETCGHCDAIRDGEGRSGETVQTRACMQNEAVERAVNILREHERIECGGIPKGEARGKIILPCGTGKTRISLRILETLTQEGQFSVVLCPSIALVAQIRREYLQNQQTPRSLRILAVCSDPTAGYDAKHEERRLISNDPTADVSNVSASEVKGEVTTDATKIAEWMSRPDSERHINVIIGTYQSGHRIVEALEGRGIDVLIADEAHRTAGLPRSRLKDKGERDKADSKLRRFTLCHDQKAFPARYRVYQTASPRVYVDKTKRRVADEELLVHSMDNSKTFGVELYRRSYIEAVDNEWLSDYRIIALGINSSEAYEKANQLAKQKRGKGQKKLTVPSYLRGMCVAMAMGGATMSKDMDVSVRSCIAFMNTVAGSRTMKDMLQSDQVREWLQGWMDKYGGGAKAAPYVLEHVDANSNVSVRDEAKHNLARAANGETPPHGVLNVGIFGEGTDAPSLSAVAFIEPRKSPVDVIQSVGRAMRKFEGKRFGLVIIPVIVPPDVDPEAWLATSDSEDWKVLAEVLLALRAHDGRIEHQLKDLLWIPSLPPPDEETTLMALGKLDGKVEIEMHKGPPGSAERDVQRKLDGRQDFEGKTFPVTTDKQGEWDVHPSTQKVVSGIHTSGTDATGLPRKEIRRGAPFRYKPKSGETQGMIDPKRTKKRVGKMMNGDEGRIVPDPLVNKPASNTRSARFSYLQKRLEDHSDDIVTNLLEKSGLTSNRLQRDMNLLRDAVYRARSHLLDDEHGPLLDQHFELINLTQGKKRADGATIAALLLMNAAMLHQRIAKGKWLPGIRTLEELSHRGDIIRQIDRQWGTITDHDFDPLIKPAQKIIHLIEDTRKLPGLERALEHVASEASHIAETYAEMGAHHSGAIYSEVMGDQASDGAFFSRPTAATLVARLALDVAEPPDADWKSEETWRRNVAVDPACGSGTLLQALLTEMKRRAREQGADDAKLNRLHEIAIEETLHGLDINVVPLQLAASRLTAGNQRVRFARMGLHRMDYGPVDHGDIPVLAGSLELLMQPKVLGNRTLNIPGDPLTPQAVDGNQRANPKIEEVLDSAVGARMVLMNPPFTDIERMGEKFTKPVQKQLRKRMRKLEEHLVKCDSDMENFISKRTPDSMFVALGMNLVKPEGGVLAMINSLAAVTSASALDRRRVLAERFYIHTIVICRHPRELNLSESTNINECIIVACRRDEVKAKADTRFIALDKFPKSEDEVDELQRAINDSSDGVMAEGWGEMMLWPAERMNKGDWTPALWRSSELAQASYEYANDGRFKTLAETGVPAVLMSIDKSSGYQPAEPDEPYAFVGLRSAGSDAHTHIEAVPNGCWKPVDPPTLPMSDQYKDPIWGNAGHLFVTAGQNAKSGRLTALASETKYVATEWMPIPQASTRQAKALAVFFNSTPGRLQLMRNLGRSLVYPRYRPTGVGKVRIPDVNDERAIGILVDCFERTKGKKVSQFGEGECEVRKAWDEAVADAMTCVQDGCKHEDCGTELWDIETITALRKLLHKEPHVSGRGHGQFDL